jgi:hypothetical protein
VAVTWRVIAVTVEDAEKGTGLWEPFWVTHNEEGEEVVLCRALVENEEENPKSTLHPANTPR